MHSNAQLYIQVSRSVIKALAQRLAVSLIEQKLVGYRRAVLGRIMAEVGAQVAALGPGEAV